MKKNKPQLTALYRAVRTALYAKHEHPQGKRAVTALKCVTMMCAGMPLTSDIIHSMGEDSGRVLRHIRRDLDVPVLTKRLKDAPTEFLILPRERDRLLDPEARQRQARLWRALTDSHIDRRIARQSRRLFSARNEQPPVWMEGIAQQELPPVTAGSTDNE